MKGEHEVPNKCTYRMSCIMNTVKETQNSNDRSKVPKQTLKDMTPEDSCVATSYVLGRSVSYRPSVEPNRVLNKI